MGEVKDILLDENGDLSIRNGDFDVGDSDAQHAEDILVSSAGDWKESPLIGANIYSFLNAPLSAQAINKMRRRIAIQMRADGLTVEELEIDTAGNIKIEVKR